MMKTPGSATIAIAVSDRLIWAISTMAIMKLKNCTVMIGAKARNIWIERMSELALLMI